MTLGTTLYCFPWSLAASESHQAQNNSQHPNVHTGLTLSGFPFLRVRLRKAPLPSSKSSCQGASGHFNADSPWLLMVAQHTEALYATSVTSASDACLLMDDCK